MMADKATIHDIARELKIAASTVSRALNGSPRISQQTKDSVLSVAKQLNYQPHKLAAALRNGRSNIIGIIVPTADRNFFGSIVRGVEEVAMNANYQVIICQTYENPAKEAAAVEALINSRVDGIITSFSKNTVNFDHFLKAKRQGIPVISFDRTNDDLDISKVLIDDFKGAYKATEHLIQQGCKRIGHFTSFQNVSIYKERRRGYLAALEHYSLPLVNELIVESNMQLEDGRRSMQKLLDERISVDGVFSSSDLGAMGALQVLKEHGIRVPDEVAIVGFSNDPFTLFSDPPISSVDQHCLRMGNIACEIFLDEVKLNGQAEFSPRKVVLMPELIVRGSSLRTSS
ncbi:LacI family DNA-binding transcriptional regulator [Chryseosolibacter indicus]|uniref:LacI family transcriptional regulator n=1 Tax=Chryseosolibacter indicus TaxID=2782351 RepID=A0ABS5VQR2_9BACT|nr:LacI family DNA-binding transcriptional regulator [Chryseosolibacter indicus]MBT1703783.1 LacI family transcriptional regulator [Chryseosolibacter indicus]